MPQFQFRRVDSSDSAHGRRSAEKLASRIGAGLASPLGILLVLPGMVSLVGSFLTLMGEQALRDSNLNVARERMLEQATLAATSVRDALEQSEPMLDRLEDLTVGHDPRLPYAAYAHALLDLMRGRHGVTYVSASFPDGTFQGAYVDRDGVTRFQDSRVDADGTHVRRYEYGARGELVPLREDLSAYDPRVRAFYVAATRAGRRVWTDPYLFYDSRAAGISRASPVYRGGSELHAVVTIDFDVNGLSSYLRGRQLRGMRALLYAREGTLLAYAAGEDAPPLALESPDDGPLRLSAVGDPLLRAFFARARSEPHSGRPRYVTVGAADQRYLGAIAPVASDPTLVWSMAYLVPERQFLRELHAYENRSLMVGGIAVLISTWLAFLFARHITRVREEAAVAKAEAREARAEAREARAEARELGSYRLVACLGRGGMGEVWRAQHRLLAREAAVKLIRTEGQSAISDALRARFRREAEALARLRSRNTIELFDYGVAEDGTFFLVMELLDGVDLDTLVQRFGPQPAARVVHLLIQVCNSLAEAHAQGLVHRDIKPANLFVCRAAEEVDVVKVLDFGLVRSAVERGEGPAVAPALGAQGGRLTHAEGMIGTPAFVAPEQAQGGALDGRADLYALGGVAFWLLTGQLVFERDNPIEQLIAHIHDPLPALRPLLPADVPEALVSLITACLAKHPSDRPPSARALGRALRAITFMPQHVWTDEHAHAWWAQYRPRPSEHPPEPEPRELAIGPTLTITKA